MDLGIEGLSDATEIGAGGNGRVYRAEQVDLGRTVAVKMLHAAYDEASQRSFHSERKLMASISSHPGIAPIYSSGTTSRGEHYFVMPYYGAGSLADRVARGPIPWRDAVIAAAAVADAVDHAHRADVLHRDLKPDNIMIDHDGRPVVVDFGIAKIVEGTVGLSQGIQLTPYYAPPEAFAGQANDRRSDLYSLGATLYAMIAGGPPFATEGGVLAIGMKVVNEPVADLRHLAPDPVCRCIERAMAKDPDARYQSGREMAEALRHVIAAADGPQTTLDPPPDPRLVAETTGTAAETVTTSPLGFAPPTPPGSSPAGSLPGSPGSPGAGSLPGPPGPPGSPGSPGSGSPSGPPGSPGSTSPPGSGSQPGPLGPSQAPPSGAGSRAVWALAAVPIVALVLAGGWFAFRQLGTDDPGPVDPVAAPGGDEPAGDEPAGEGTDEAVGEVPFEDLAQGDCFDAPIDSSIFFTVDVVPCDEPHTAEVTGLLQHPDAGGTYPGLEELWAYAVPLCASVFQTYVGADQLATELGSSSLAPIFEKWTDEQIYNIWCIASRVDGEPQSGSVAGAGDDPAVALDPGDVNTVARMPFAACFGPIDPDAEFAVGNVAGRSQLVIQQDCASPHRGQIVGGATLGGGAETPYVFETVLGDGVQRCRTAFADAFGIEGPEGLNAIIPDVNEWQAGDRLVTCAVLWVEPTLETYG